MTLVKDVTFRQNSFVPVHVLPGLHLLQKAYRYSQELNRDAWDFAEEIRGLRAVGLTNNDFRWLIWKGYVEQAYETTSTGDVVRQFSGSGGIVFSKRSCFILTETGAEVTEKLFGAMPTVNESTTFPILANGDDDAYVGQKIKGLQRPQWDPNRHQLTFAGAIVKEYKLKSPNQEAILMAFEEENWPPCIDDPLSPQPNIDAKERLRNTIKSLNRKQVNRLIHFMGNGTGQAVRWESLPLDNSASASHR